MLQINTGKLFQGKIEYTNNLRGVLYTNAHCRSNDIITKAGTLRATGGGLTNRAVVYELKEIIEETKTKPGIICSHSVNTYLRDFAIVASFGLGALFSVDDDIVKRLISEKGEFSSYYPPKKFIHRFFDEQVLIQKEDRDAFVTFVDDLLALERRFFLVAMRAMRTYIAGLHSIPDDLGLAYTLLVSAVETIAQGIDSKKVDWEDIEEKKRKKIDKALKNTSKEVSDDVREAIIETENIGLSKRYREFILSKVKRDYYRTKQGLHRRPITKTELPQALKQAYTIRSQYIHSAKALADSLTNPHDFWEVTEIKRRPVLTLQGLARLTNYTIRKFISDGPKVEKEKYDYTFERAGIIIGQMSPEYWVGNPLLKPKHARKRIEGLLQQLEGIEKREKGASITDMRPVLEDVERLLPQAKQEHKPALYILHVLFNRIVQPDDRSPEWKSFMEKYSDLGNIPESEIIIARTIFGNHSWKLEDHHKAYKNYWNERQTRLGLHAPRIFEAAIALDLAERYRSLGDQDSTAKELIADAVESFPEYPGLREFETNFKFTEPIIWRNILLPKKEVN